MPRSETDHYLGNPLLKAAGVEQQFTQEEIKEYMKELSDLFRFFHVLSKLLVLCAACWIKNQAAHGCQESLQNNLI